MIVLTFHHNRLPEPREPVLCFSSASIVFTYIVIRLHQTERTGRWMLRFGWPGCLRTFCSRLQCFSQINSEQQPFATKLDPLTADQTTHVLRSMLLGWEKINSEHSLFFFESRPLDTRAHRCEVYLGYGIWAQNISNYKLERILPHSCWLSLSTIILCFILLGHSLPEVWMEVTQWIWHLPFPICVVAQPVVLYKPTITK